MMLSDYASYELGNIKEVPDHVEAYIVSGIAGLEAALLDANQDKMANYEAAKKLEAEIDVLREVIQLELGMETPDIDALLTAEEPFTGGTTPAYFSAQDKEKQDDEGGNCFFCSEPDCDNECIEATPPSEPPISDVPITP